MNQILAAVLPAIASAAAATAAVLFLTKNRLRQERGFDRRLVWCESMMRAINAAGAAVFSASTADDACGCEDCWSETIRLYENLIPLCGLRKIYAPQDAVLRIEEFMSTLESLIKAHLDSHRTGALAIQCEPCLVKLRCAPASLSHIARSHLGLEALPDTTDLNGWFVGSFRGYELGEHRSVFTKEGGRPLTYAAAGGVATTENAAWQ
jgi:hypothetical protein